MEQIDLKKDPDYFNRVKLQDFSLEEAIKKVKLLVNDLGDEYSKQVDQDMVDEFYTNTSKRQMPMSSLKRTFANRIKKKIDISAMEEWAGIMLGSLDNKKYDQGLDTVQGQSRIYLRHDGAIKDISHYGGSINRKTPPDLQRSTIRVKPNDWTNPKTGITREGWNVMHVEEEEEIPLSELHTLLMNSALDINDLTEELKSKYPPVIVRGRVGFVSPADKWVVTDTLIEDKDKNGNIQYEKNEDGTFKTTEDGVTRIVKMKYKREKDTLGQPLKMNKYGSGNETQWLFKVSLHDRDDSNSNNRLSVQFQQTRLGSQHILMDQAELTLQDAASLPVGGSEDPFESIRDMWQGKDVIIVGKLIQASEWDGKMWYGINGTLIFDEELIKNTQTIVKETPASTPAPEPKPEIVAETVKDTTPAPAPTPAPTPAVTYEPELQPQTTPPVPPPAPTPSTAPVQNEDKLLEQAIVEAFDTLGDDIDYEMLMTSLSVGVPEKFKHETQKLKVLTEMDRIRKERRSAKVASEPAPEPVAAPAPVVETVVEEQPEKPAAPAPKPSELLPPEKILEMIGEDKPEIEVVSNPDDEAVPTGHIRCACGEILAFEVVENHKCVPK